MSKYKRGSGYRIITPIGDRGDLLALLHPTQCDGCGENMHMGQHVTRHHKKDRTRGSFDDKHDLFCQSCYPFRYAMKRSDTYQTASKFPVEPNLREYWI